MGQPGGFGRWGTSVKGGFFFAAVYAVIGAWQLVIFVRHGGTVGLIIASLSLLAAAVQLVQTVRRFRAQKAAPNKAADDHPGR